MSIILLTSTLTISWWRDSGLGLAILSYAILQVLYNLRLKRTVILDVVAIAIGFILRACAGAAATGIVLSSWFILCTAMLALFLGIEKRKAELRLSELRGKKSRAVLHRYSLSLLNRMENVATNGTWHNSNRAFIFCKLIHNSLWTWRSDYWQWLSNRSPSYDCAC